MIVLRFSEIGIKSKPVRRAFTLKLIQNVKEALQKKGYRGFSVWTDSARIYVEGVRDNELDLFTHIFGVSSISSCMVFSFESLDDIVKLSRKIFTPIVNGKKYAVRVRRTGIHPFRSPDVERVVGAQFTSIAEVNLSNPEVVLHIEIRDNRAFFYDRVVKGPGGLPIGTQGKVLSLISGGFDSALASWFMMKRGTEVDYLFLNLGGPPHLVVTAQVARFLRDEWGVGYPSRFFAIDGNILVEEMREKVNPHYWNLILKRVLYEVSVRVAKRMGQEALVTGESLGQVSSQTLKNLASLSMEIDLPIFRPLLGFDKEEIISQAKKIGTYYVSEGLTEYCQLVPRHPKTHASFENIMRERDKLSPDILDGLLQTLEEIDLGLFEKIALEKEIEIDEIPEDAIFIDVRTRSEYEAWHYPGALFLERENLKDFLENLPKKKPLVVYCTKGRDSKLWALWLNSKGITAWSFKGGAIRLKKLLSESKREYTS